LKLVCISAYNEENHISDVINKAKSHVDRIIVYVDSSTNYTTKPAKEEIITWQKLQTLARLNPMTTTYLSENAFSLCWVRGLE